MDIRVNVQATGQTDTYVCDSKLCNYAHRSFPHLKRKMAESKTPPSLEGYPRSIRISPPVVHTEVCIERAPMNFQAGPRTATVDHSDANENKRQRSHAHD